MLFITEQEYDDYSDEMKGRVTSEYMEDGLHRSFMWNRVLIIAKVMYIEGLNMVITRGKR